MSIGALKGVLLLVILAAGWIGGLVPLRRTIAESPRFLSLGNAFAAGVFLGIGLIHMLGTASEAWRQTLGWGYPMGLLLAGGAFLLLLWFEHVALPGRAHDAFHEPGGVISDLDPTGAASDERNDAHGPRWLQTRPVSRLYPYALVVALSIHSLIAGIAMGAQRTIANVVLLFVAIVAHKATAGFALGVSLARNAVPRRRALGLIGLFAGVTPIGIIVGLLVTNALDDRSQSIFDAVFLGLAAGSFIYIASFDIIRDEFLQPGPRAAKWLLAATGYGLMGLLALWL
ncbi:MAG: ZIP family metal transporter [Myxococcota bacterium]